MPALRQATNDARGQHYDLSKRAISGTVAYTATPFTLQTHVVAYAAAPDDPAILSGADVDGTADAVRLLADALDHVAFSPRLRARLVHAIARFDKELERNTFGTNAVLLPDTEQAALTMLRTTAEQLHQAGEALDGAAHVLRESGKGLAANRTKQAANAAHAAADELVSS